MTDIYKTMYLQNAIGRDRKVLIYNLSFCLYMYKLHPQAFIHGFADKFW
jgi:hypothetical protein